MSTEIARAEDYGLTVKQGSEIVSMFHLLEQEKVVLVQEYNDIIKKELTVELSAEGADLDKRMQKHLKAKKEIHSAKKAFFLNGGRFCDSIFNIEKTEFGIMREVTGKIRYFAENIKKAKFAKLQLERVSLLSKVMEDAGELDLASMREDVWDAFLATKQKAFEVEQERLVALENERLAKVKADEIEHKRVIAQNAQLLKEREDQQRVVRLEAEKEAASLKIKKDDFIFRLLENGYAHLNSYTLVKGSYEIKHESLERFEEHEFVARVNEVDKNIAERALAAEKSKKEREDREKLEAELQLKKDAELLAAENEKIRLQNELSKGDEDKVVDLVADLKALREKYSFNSEDNKAMFNRVIRLLNDAIKIIN